MMGCELVKSGTLEDDFFNSPLYIGGRKFACRLIQGPLAGFSCAPFRQLYYQYTPPAYCVSEMISAHDVLHKHARHSRYIYRAPDEQTLCYQLSGTNAFLMAEAALYLESIGADLIDLNCGCPKTKIRKKGAGSALLDSPERLVSIVARVRERLTIPLTVKLRIQGDERDVVLVQAIAAAGADALIVHGRRWTDEYDAPCNYQHIARMKQSVHIPVIANGDITDKVTLAKALALTGCDAYMIARAGSGNPWLYQQLLAMDADGFDATYKMRQDCFMRHVDGLAKLDGDFSAVLQSRALARYYFKQFWCAEQFQAFYKIDNLFDIEKQILVR